MSIQVEDVSESRKKLSVLIKAIEIANEEKKLIVEFSKQARIPGFRPGKAPVSMIISKYGKDVAQELKRKVVAIAFDRITKDDSIKVYTIVELQEGKIESGKDATMEFTVDLDPCIDLPDYKGIAVTVPEIEVTDEEVDETVYTLRSQRADFVEKESEALESDYVQLRYEGFLSGKPLSETINDQPIFSKQNSTWEEAGTERADFPGLAKELVGLKKGDEKEITVDFPFDFRVEALQGKSVKYKLNITEVREKKLPEIDEEFLKSISVESEQQLKENVLKDIRKRKEQESNQIKREQIMNFLAEKSAFALPQSAVDGESSRILQGMLQEQAHSQEALDNPEITQLEMQDRAKEEAGKRVKINLILNKISELEEIKPEDQDFQTLIFQEAMYTQQKPEQIAKDLRKDQGRMRSMHESILINKTLDFLTEQSTVSKTLEKSGKEKNK